MSITTGLVSIYPMRFMTTRTGLQWAWEVFSSLRVTRVSKITLRRRILIAAECARLEHA